MSESPPGLLVTATDTEVGKTYVAALIAKALVAAGHRVGVYKPVASGCRRESGALVSDDAVRLWEAAGRPAEPAHVCPQMFAAPLAPHLAARAEGCEVDAARLREGLEYWKPQSDVIVVEGVGGLMSPISADDYVADLAFEFGYPLVVVVPNVLGTINQTLQTLITAATFREGLDIAGIVLNHPRRDDADSSTASNRRELSERCAVPLLASVAHGGDDFDTLVDWFALAAAGAVPEKRGD